MAAVSEIVHMPAHVVWDLCGFLPFRDILRLSSTNKPLRRALTSRQADVALWKSCVVREVGRLCDSRGLLAPPVELSKWNVSTYRRLFEVLYKCGDMLGNWRWDVPVRGGLLVVSLDEDDGPVGRCALLLNTQQSCFRSMASWATCHTKSLAAVYNSMWP